MLRQSQAIPKHAYELFESAVRDGDDALIGVRIKNWSEAAKQAGDARKQYLNLQERTRQLISVGHALEVLSA
ncbi:hypothetical protein RZS08_66240, partial [Arthrospira platensis SPKY1]|nr:hypothetical protein [Arthrospira platensis SPKY1]